VRITKGIYLLGVNFFLSRKNSSQIDKKAIQLIYRLRDGGEPLKIRTEISDHEEIVIRCRQRTERIRSLEAAVENAVRGENEIPVSSGGREIFLPKNRILFFESSEGRVYAHTAEDIYIAPYKLCELESIMPPTFARISKSVIANLMRISSVRRELVGNGEITFADCDKKTYFSRAYYKLMQYKLDEMRFKK